MAITGPFVWGAGGAALTPEDIARQRELEAQLVAKGVDTSPVASWTQGAARLADAVAGSFRRGRLDNAALANRDADKAMQASLIPFLTGTGGASAVAGPSADAAAPTGTPIASAGAIPPGDPNAIQSQFIDTVKNGYDAGNGQKLAVTNPYGLAAIAATGKAESGYDPKNAGGTWADGANPAGGIMSWNGPRLSNLQKFAGGGNGTPEQQGQFFLQENPDLITKLNSAKSIDEAQNLMNNAWAFKGYNQPGNPNAAHRLALANGYLPQFQGQSTGGAQVASLDPSAGMGSMPPAVTPQGQLPTGGAIPVPQPRPDMQQAQIDPATASPTQMMSALGIQPDPSVDTRVAAAPQQVMPPLSPPVDIPTQPIAAPQQVAQAAPVDRSGVGMGGGAPGAGTFPTAPSASQGGGVSPAVIAALTSPTSSPATKQLAGAIIQQSQQRQQAALQYQYDQKKAVYEQQLKQTDPVYLETLRKAKYENDHLGQITPDTQATLTAQENKMKFDANQALVVADHTQQLKNEAPITPTDQARLDLDRDKFKAEVSKGQWQKLTDGRLYNETTGEFRDAPPPIAGSTPMKPDDISSIRKEVQQLPSYKNLAQAAPIYQSMAETFGRNTKASDLNMVYGLGKIMDPTSVVREGEVDMAKNTASWPDYLKGALETLKGGASLDPQTRSAIMKEAYGRISGYNNEFKQSMVQYQGIAKRYNLNPDDIIPQVGDFKEIAAPSDAGPTQIQSVDDYNKLPSGTPYIDPNGKARVKQ